MMCFIAKHLRCELQAVQLRELEGQLSEARQSGLALDAVRADLEAQLTAAREERDAAAAREAGAREAATETESRLASQAADAQRQVKTQALTCCVRGCFVQYSMSQSTNLLCVGCR